MGGRPREGRGKNARRRLSACPGLLPPLCATLRVWPTQGRVGTTKVSGGTCTAGDDKTCITGRRKASRGVGRIGGDVGGEAGGWAGFSDVTTFVRIRSFMPTVRLPIGIYLSSSSFLTLQVPRGGTNRHRRGCPVRQGHLRCTWTHIWLWRRGRGRRGRCRCAPRSSAAWSST